MKSNKYRVWDKVHKEMYNWETVRDEFTTADFENDDLVWMQDTGVVDREEREIYEGDILNVDNLWQGKVVYERGCYMVTNNTEKEPLIAVYLFSVVIGNVYEEGDR